jgi:hypothetical protein
MACDILWRGWWGQRERQRAVDHVRSLRLEPRLHSLLDTGSINRHEEVLIIEPLSLL